jgi:hypothetical protein
MMKEHKKQSILAGLDINQLDEEYVAAIIEQEQETKPSRISNKVFNTKRKSKRKDWHREYQDE